jgi:ABC-type multidrug transport system fused ATPase/permease subunit
VSELLGPKFIQIGIDRYLTDFRVPRVAARGIFIVSGIYFGNLIVGWLLSIFQVRSAIAAGQGAVNDLRESIFEHIQRLSLSYFDKTHQGRIIARADTDLSSLDEIMTWGANQFLASILTLVGVIILMLQYDWRLCLAVSVVFAGARLRHASLPKTRHARLSRHQAAGLAPYCHLWLKIFPGSV